MKLKHVFAVLALIFAFITPAQDAPLFIYFLWLASIGVCIALFAYLDNNDNTKGGAV